VNTSALETVLTRMAAPLDFNPRAWAAFFAALGTRRLSKGEHLIREGDDATALFFVNSGLLRYYYLAGGAEHTGQFFSAGMFVADVLALTADVPCVQNIDALEDGDVIVIPKPALLAAYDADHAFERFGRRVMEQSMAGSQRRSAGLLTLSADERYTRFVTARPDVAPRVPQYLIASYLGITPEALSRIRRRRTRTEK
jgi:CRP-like cAMP-binding protein